MELESDVEKRLKERVKSIGGLCLKFTSPSHTGVPDRIVIYKGLVCFVEVKKPGEVLRPKQKWWQGKLEFHGVLARDVSTKQEVETLVEWIKRKGVMHEG